jgi:2-keto-4-pentenoate hydratase/2-oxohepta-3-ene-1,7-dioic acid hydratase in catechol pathway
MKLIRFQSKQKNIMYGVFDQSRPDSAYIIEGDIFEVFHLTRESTEIEKILPPVSPPNILALGLNYRRHADETNIRYPSAPVIFIKGTNSIIGPGSPIILPKAGPDEVDYEGELAIIIGTKTKNVSAQDAVSHILGYTCANDVSARDWQIRLQKKQWARGKSFDTFCPIGPCIVTPDDIPDPNNLRIRTILNGETLQDSSTSDMIFDVPAIVSDLSCSMTLLPGTVILTGTPEGVGFTRQPPVFLKDDEVVTISIEKIGELTNPVAKEV